MSETFFDDIDRERQGAEAVSFAQRALVNAQISDAIRQHPDWPDADVAEQVGEHLRQPIDTERVAEVRARD